MHLRPAQSAFSLVELSIVLVILGLLTGGILGGQSLIRAAELRSVTADAGRYTAAVMSFRDKYFAMPGDMANATAFWGTAASCPNGASSTVTCNGDGDGTIDYDNSVDSPYEGYRAWQHLANAGLVEGNYTGEFNTSLYTPGVNAPRSRLANGVWGLWWVQTRAMTGWGPPSGGTLLAIGSISGSATGRWHNALFKPEEAWNIDAKVDDGRPFTGAVNSMGSAAIYAPNCTDGDSMPIATAVASTYNLDFTGTACLLMFTIN